MQLFDGAVPEHREPVAVGIAAVADDHTAMPDQGHSTVGSHPQDGRPGGDRLLDHIGGPPAPGECHNPVGELLEHKRVSDVASGAAVRLPVGGVGPLGHKVLGAELRRQRIGSPSCAVNDALEAMAREEEPEHPLNGGVVGEVTPAANQDAPPLRNARKL